AEPVGDGQHAAAAASFPTRPGFPAVEIGMAAGSHPVLPSGRVVAGEGARTRLTSLLYALGLLTAADERGPQGIAAVPELPAGIGAGRRGGCWPDYADCNGERRISVKEHQRHARNRSFLPACPGPRRLPST